MKRPAIACLWIGSIVATWVGVRQVTTDEVAVAVRPAVARERTAGRVPRLPAREVPRGIVALEVPDDDVAFREVLATLERDLADGRWGVEDRDRLNRGLLTVTAPQASELYDVLFPKLNEGTVTSDIQGPPI